ncbi:MAG: hypothetical protein ACYTF8_04655 [Planctomycetota bacterium]|jgi:hypothetical protein
MIRQAEVTAFYDRMTFPSGTSHAAYAALVPAALRGRRVGDFGCGQSLFRETFRRLGCEAVFLAGWCTTCRSSSGPWRRSSGS